MRRHLLLQLYAIILTSTALSAQEFPKGSARIYLDSAADHYLQFDSILSKKHSGYRVREFYRKAIMSSGKTSFMPDGHYLNMILYYGIASYQNHWYDTIVIFNFQGDTLQYYYQKDAIKLFDIQYNNNQRTQVELFKPHRISYTYTDDGIIEEYYRKKHLRKIVCRPDSGIVKTYYYSKAIAEAPYYCPEDRHYVYFYTNELKSTNIIPIYVGTKIRHNQYRLIYIPRLNTERYSNIRILQNYPFFKQQYRRLTRRYWRKSDQKSLLFSIDSSRESTTTQRYHKRHLVYNKFTSYKGDTSTSELYYKKGIFKSTYRYQTDQSHGHIIFKKRRFYHLDTVIYNQKTYTTTAVYKNHFYYFKTNCNTIPYRSGRARFYLSNKRPKGLSQYNDNPFKMYVMDDIISYIHQFEFAEADTFFQGDTSLILSEHTIYLKTQEQQSILYDSLHMIHHYVVKDQSKCAMGLKNEQNQWVIPPQYDHIQSVRLPGNYANLYYASINDYGILFNYKGKMLIPPCRGLSDQIVPLQTYYTSALDRINRYAFVCNDRTTDSFKLIDPFNRTVFSGAGFFDLTNLSARIRQQGKMQLKILNTGDQIHWLKDTMEYIGMNTMLLYELQPDAQGRQLRLLNTSSRKLEPDTFCIFYHNAQSRSLGLESRHRRLFYSHGLLTLIDSMKLPVERFYRYGDYLILQQADKFGLAEDNKLLLMPQYDAVQISGSVLFALKDSSLLMFDRLTGKLIRSLGGYRLSTPISKGISEFPIIEHSYGNKSFFEIKMDGKYGLMDQNGRTILPCIYPYIDAGRNLINLPVSNGPAILTVDEEGVIQAWELQKQVNGDTTPIRKTYPLQPIDYSDYEHHRHYIGFSGHRPQFSGTLITPKPSQINRNITTYYVYDLKDSSAINTSNRFSFPNQHQLKLSAKLDEQLEAIVRFDTFEQVQDEQLFYYIMTKDKRCGVLDKNFKTLIPAQYRYISYDPEHLLLWYKDEEQAMWTLRNLSQDTVTADSLDYPVSFESGKSSAIVSRNGYFGELYKTGFLLIPPIYERVSEITHNQTTQIFYKNNTIYTQSYYTYRGLVPQPYEKLYMPAWAKNQGTYNLYGVKGKKLYAIRNFQAFDSSDHLFLDKSPFERELNKHQNLQQENSSTYDIRLRKTRLCHLIENTALEYMFWWHSPSPRRSFPEYRYVAPNNQLFKGAMKPWQAAGKDSLTSSRASDTPLLQLEDILKQPLELVSEGYNTLSYRGKQYLHLLFDSANVYKFTLEDIIDPGKKAAFTEFLHKLWLKQENPTLACVPANQIFDLFNKSYYMSSVYFNFLPGSLNLLVRIDNVAEYMSPEWARRFGY